MKILIAVDDTEESIDAVHSAYEFFGPEPDYLITSIGEIHTQTYPMTPTGGLPAYMGLDNLAGAIEEGAMATAVQAAEELESAASIEVITGSPGAAICRIAEKEEVSVIVIGSHDKSIWQRLFDPSVGKYVVDNALCPVLVVR